MQRSFTYQRHILNGERIIYAGAVGMVVMSWFLPFLYFNYRIVSWQALARIASLLSLTVLAGAMLASLLNRELKKTVYILFDDRLVRKGPRGVRTVYLPKVRRFVYRRIPLLGGFGMIGDDKTRIMLPFIIRDLGQCVESLRNRLVSDGREDCFDPRQIERFYRDSRISDLTEERTFGLLRFLGRLTFYTALGSALVSVYVWFLPASFSIAWTLLASSFPAAGYLSATTAISRDLRPLLGNQKALSGYDPAPAYARAGLTFALAYLAVGIAYREICWYLLIR